MEIFKQILHKIKEYDTIIIHRHMRPDPDALGSQVGLKKLLQVNFPEKKIKVAGKTEPTLAWLAKMDDVSDDDYKHALVIVCDTANTARIDDERYNKGDFLIKIDHHPNDMLELSVIQDVSYILPQLPAQWLSQVNFASIPLILLLWLEKWTLSAIKLLNFKAMFMTI